jgi:Asp-tRNA(Asn)/Glu-tRNA(Gln) amidotransferase A subunit family amidase
MNLFLKYPLKKIYLLLKNNKIKFQNLYDDTEFAIKKYEKNVQSFTTINLEHYNSSCKYLDTNKLCQKNFIHGIPVGIKDIFNTKEFPTEMGSELWKNFNPGNNARCVERLIEKGSVVIGKTVTAEFAVHELNQTKNPHNYEYTPGTSSSGSAAAVACGIVPYALASQTAGSIIRPANFCGVWGMKPSFGLIPRTGVLKTTDSLDTIGFISSHGENLVHILDSIRVSGPNYPYVYKNIDCNLKKDKNIKIGFIKTYTWSVADDYIKDAIYKIIENIEYFEKIKVEEIVLNKKFNNSHLIHDCIYKKSLAYYFSKEAIYSNKISKIMKEMIDDGDKILLNQYYEALKLQEILSNELSIAIERYDLVITLGAASSAPKRNNHEKLDPSLIWTLCHVPAVAIPIGKNNHNLPFGFQVICKRWGDYRLLKIIERYIREKIFINGSIPIINS